MCKRILPQQTMFLIALLVLLSVLFPPILSHLLPLQSACEGFFCADLMAYPNPNEMLLVESLAEIFEALRLTLNTNEDSWLVYPVENGYQVIDFGSDYHQYDTVSEVNIEHEQMLAHLLDTVPDWFVLLHQHPVGTVPSPSSTDLVYLYSVETGLDDLFTPPTVASVVVFRDGYYLFSLTENFRTLMRTSVYNPQPILPDPTWSSFQMRWDCFMVQGHDMVGDFPDYRGFAEAGMSMVDITYFADAEELANTLIQRHTPVSNAD